jgi:hypothetical protein
MNSGRLPAEDSSAPPITCARKSSALAALGLGADEIGLVVTMAGEGEILLPAAASSCSFSSCL